MYIFFPKFSLIFLNFSKFSQIFQNLEKFVQNMTGVPSFSNSPSGLAYHARLRSLHSNKSPFDFSRVFDRL